MENGIERIIRERRTIKSFTDRPIEKQDLLNLLNAAVWAPFHSKEEPWRFIIFREKGRKVFSDAVLSTYTPAELERFGEGAAKEYCDKTPVHLLVVVREERDPWKMKEAMLAAAAFIQNLQLLAWEQGIGFVWKTSEYNRENVFTSQVGISPEECLIGTLHVGYINKDHVPKPRPRKPAEELVTWVEG
ncbi:nitroreductase [Paenibacillus tritici]|uniref:Putative NAD(P)H nitroreductase n=1 Tax=Paenibacillus tritici TaxID=1873425 RepID=A0ABX2DRY5_9BACL|nr:nitroreductase [Paenibacillus tritici]NQX46606.1 nitroreductase [Paenibacillus tritici]